LVQATRRCNKLSIHTVQNIRQASSCSEELPKDGAAGEHGFVAMSKRYDALTGCAQRIGNVFCDGGGTRKGARFKSQTFRRCCFQE
jgi:hypothetical protein